MADKYPQLQGVLEFWAALYNELNRESKYFEILIKLFDVYAKTGNIPKASEALEKLVDIDAYDYRNQERLESLRGRVDDTFFKRVAGRLARSSSPTAAAPAQHHAPRKRSGDFIGAADGSGARVADAGRFDRADGNIFAVFAAQ